MPPSTPPTTPLRSRVRQSKSSLKSSTVVTHVPKKINGNSNFKAYLALTLFTTLAFFSPLSQAISVQRYWSLGRDLFDGSSSALTHSVELDHHSSVNSSHHHHHQFNASDSSHSADSALNQTFISIARSAALDSPRASWEQGTLANALLELNAASWTGFAKTQYHEAPPFDILRFGVRAVVNQDSVGRLSSRVTGDESTSQGAALDSASSGPVVLLAAKANNSLALASEARDPSTLAASYGMLMRGARRQFLYVNNTTPRSNTGFISQRATGVQAWADSGYMGPPFLAAYGELTKSQQILQSGYQQMSLLRGYLRKDSKLWGHIFDVDSNRYQAEGSWLTGEGWSLYGMIRVLLSIHQSDFSNGMNSQKKDLINWINELLEAVVPFVDDDSGLFHNYVDQPSTFLDGSGSMLIAASIYRLASILPSSLTKASSYISIADKIYAKTSSSLDQFGLFTNGVQVVSVLGFDDAGFVSVESLSFGMMMHSAKRDYSAGNTTTVNVN